MKQISSINQLRSLLKNKREEKVLAGIIANLHPDSAEQFCLMCIAHLRFKIRPVSDNAFLYGVTVNFLNFLKADRDEETFQISWSVNPVMMAANQVYSPENYRELLFLDTTITKKEADDYIKAAGINL